MTDQGAEAATPAADPHEDPTASRWGFAEGDEIVPRRTAIKRLGGGYRYEAYLAWDDHLRSLVVCKVVRPGLVEDRRTLRGLATEVEMLERLNHPVVVRSFGAVLDGPRPHVVLEHLEGPRLSTLVRKYGPLASEQLVPLALQVASAIHYLGEEGVVHLDVKASNIIMGAPPRLIDLSVAHTVESCREITAPVGTDSYMAPEQCLPEGEHELGPPADVWGLGVTLYRAACGERPFSKGDPNAGDPARRWTQLVETPNPLPDAIPAEIAEPIMSCLAHDPGDRPTPAAVADRLESVLEVLPRPKLSKLKPRLGERRRRRRR